MPALYLNDRDGVRTFNKCTIRIGAFVEFHVGFAQVVDRSQFLVIEVAACGLAWCFIARPYGGWPSPTQLAEVLVLRTFVDTP